jgi:hypothetical protein
MAQHDYVIANDTAANVRADINNALAAVASNNSGAAAPATIYANEWWYDTATDTLKIRAEANDAWISVALLNQTTDQAFPIVGGVTVTSTGTELNLLDGAAAGTIVNSKAVIYGAAGQVNATTLQIAGVAITSTAAELNILDGVTSTTAELNILDGVTATAAELNYVDITTLGVAQASKALTVAANGTITFSGSTGTSGQVLTSGGSGAAPSWANAPAPTTAQVGTATAGLAVGDVGSYALLQQTTSSTSRSPGATLAGSSLRYAHCGGGQATAPSGTWMLAGQIPSTTAVANNTSVWLRIS